MDLFSEILQAVQLRGTVYFHARFQPPWGMAIPAGRYANYHLVTGGSCWLQCNDKEAPIHIQKGDMVLFPKGDSHTLSDSVQSNIISADELLNSPRTNNENEVIFGGDGAETTTMICGHFEYQNDLSHPLFDTLPPLIHISKNESGKPNWFSTASELAAQISSSPESAGKNAIINKLAESLFIQALVAYLETLDNSSSFLAAIQDRNIALALTAMHKNITHDWNLAELANIATMSKSVFSERFNKLVGESPILYLSHWRMLKAHALLIDTVLPIKQIADKVGYQSEFSFSKAFKKLTGSSPGEIRKSSKN